MKISVNWLKEFVAIESSPRELKAGLTMIGLNTESIAQAGDDWVLDVEVTTNRPDCLNHYGVARELATLYRQPLKKLEVLVAESGGPALGLASIAIWDTDLCARYCGRVVRNVKVGPSPEWLVKRLEAVGQRSINNVADVTNYVLMELGHPLHAFDLSRLKEQKIIVRRAKPGEPLRTLDGVDRTLTHDNLVIADGVHPVALAGVMGGEESEISPATHTVLLESAWFEPVSIRRTSKSQGMHTEASHRFERGADIEMAPLALDRTAALIQEIAGGEILEGMIDVYPRPMRRDDIVLRKSEITRILGAEVTGPDFDAEKDLWLQAAKLFSAGEKTASVARTLHVSRASAYRWHDEWKQGGEEAIRAGRGERIPEDAVERILSGLGFQVKHGGGATWRVSVPSFRVDVSREVDLVEEVARHVGYDRLPARVRPAPPRVERDTTRDKIITTSSLLVTLGYHEIITTSMVDPGESERFSASLPVVLANPLSQDASAMRTSAVPSMLRAIRWNLDRGANDVRLFELGKTYSMSSEGVAQERRVLTLGATGHRRAASVYDSAAPLDFFDLKGDLEMILWAFDVPALAFDSSGRSYLERGRSGRLSSEGREFAVFGLFHQDLAREYKLRQEVWVAEIDLEFLLEFALRPRKFQPISKFPEVERDFSLVLPEDLPYARLSSAIAGLAMEEIRSFRPVDRFRGGTISPGCYSLLLRITFQSQTHTLTSEEVGGLSQRLLAALEGLGARLRS